MTQLSHSESGPQVAVPTGVFAGPLRLISVGLVIVVTLIAFEAMAVATAMPTAARDLHGLAHYGWAFSGFIVANIVGMVASGVLSDRRGPRIPLVLGLTAFFAGLLLSGLASDMLMFIGGRVVQGLGGGTLLTALYVIIGESYPDHLRPKIFAAISSAWVLPSLIGPPVAGFLTQHVGWRWVFLGLAPLVLVGAVLIAPQLRRMSTRRRAGVNASGRSRLLRAVTVAAGVAALVQTGQDPTWLWLAAVPVAVAALAWGLRGLLPPGTVSVRPGVSATVAMRGLLAGAMFGTEAFIPLALSVQHGYSATAAGMPLLGSALAWALGSWWQGREAVDARRPRLIRMGFLLLTVGAAGAAVASLPGAPGWLMYLVWPFAGLGAGLAMSSVGVLMLAQTTDADRGRDSSALQLSDGVVSAFTTGLGGVLVAAAAHGRLNYTTSFVTIDGAMVVLSAAGVVLAARTRPLTR